MFINYGKTIQAILSLLSISYPCYWPLMRLIVYYLYSLKLFKTYSIKIGSYEREKEPKHQDR